MPLHLSRARYIVNIQKNGRSHCAGTILDADVIITSHYCIDERPGVTFTILSNSRLRNNGTPHHVIRRSFTPLFGFGNSVKIKQFCFIYNKRLQLTILFTVAVKITPPIELQHGLNVKIDLFLGVIPPLASGYFTGWGCNYQGSE